jgi:uncharacterized membrane protein YsdA (DUF1294 family)
MQLNMLFIPFLIISFIAAIITAFDKQRAKAKSWRVSEKVLLLISILGGSVAMLAIMLLIHHKTRHLKFMIGLPFIIILQCVAFYFAFRYGVLKYQ